MDRFSKGCDRILKVRFFIINISQPIPGNRIPGIAFKRFQESNNRLIVATNLGAEVSQIIPSKDLFWSQMNRLFIGLDRVADSLHAGLNQSNGIKALGLEPVVLQIRRDSQRFSQLLISLLVVPFPPVQKAESQQQIAARRACFILQREFIQ